MKEIEMGAAINAERERRGLRPLAWSENLAAAARRHAADMAAHPGLVHTGSDGSEAWERILGAGYPAAQWYEVVGWGYGGEVEPMLGWWLASPEHMVKVLAGDVEDVGIGYATGTGAWGHYWAVDLGTADWRGRYE